jgi:hypothetical protein
MGRADGKAHIKRAPPLRTAATSVRQERPLGGPHTSPRRRMGAAACRPPCPPLEGAAADPESTAAAVLTGTRGPGAHWRRDPAASRREVAAARGGGRRAVGAQRAGIGERNPSRWSGGPPWGWPPALESSCGTGTWKGRAPSAVLSRSGPHPEGGEGKY